MKKITFMLMFFLFFFSSQAQISFVEDTSTPFFDAGGGEAAFFDADNDNDLDVIITGNGEAKLYKNDGTGTFSEYNANQFVGILISSVAVADVDGDQDRDVVINGVEQNTNMIIRLYLNDGQGNFTENTPTNFLALDLGDMEFSDVNNDGDQDLLTTGQYGNDFVTFLYLNDGTGNFTITTAPALIDVAVSALAFEDVDNDGDQDLMLSGQKNSTNIYLTRLYKNDGTGNFTEVMGAPF